MKKTLLSILSILSISLSQADEITFTVNKDFANSNSKSKLFLFGQPNTEITLTNSNNTFNEEVITDDDGKAIQEIPSDLNLTDSGINNNKAITISSGSPISAYLLNRHVSTSPDAGELSYLLNNDALGDDYYVPTWYTTSGTIAQLSITAVEDDTRVVVNSPVNLSNADFSANTDRTIDLDKGQTYFIIERVDFSGLHLTSNKKVAVFSSNQNAVISSGISGPIYSQIIPTSAAGTKYIVPTPNGSRESTIRIIAAAQMDADVSSATTPLHFSTIEAGKFEGFGDLFNFEITSTNDIPIIVTQYIETESSGRPAMTIIPPSDQWLSNYSYGFPHGENAFRNNYLNIIIEKDANNQANVSLNGELIDESEFNLINSASDYLEASISIDVSIKPFGHVTADRLFQLTISGESNANSFLTIAGTAASPGARLLSPQVASTQTIPSINKLGLLMTALLLIASVTLVIRRRT